MILTTALAALMLSAPAPASAAKQPKKLRGIFVVTFKTTSRHPLKVKLPPGTTIEVEHEGELYEIRAKDDTLEVLGGRGGPKGDTTVTME